MQDIARYHRELDAVDPAFVTRKGNTVHTRLIRPDDGERLIEFFLRLSPESRRRRWHAPIDQFDPETLRQAVKPLVRVDNLTNGGAVLGVVHEDGVERVIGVARLMRTSPDPDWPEAEAAVVVRDDYHGQGVASELLYRMVLLAKRMSVKTILAIIEADNAPAIQVFRELNLPTQSHTSHGETVMHISVPGRQENSV
jgi:RimJ/RimL family protein N-acetyltransferase